MGHETFCYDDLTVRENLLFSARASGHRPADADAALERMGLTGVRDVVHRRLSAGQRRRLALAVALSRDPRLCCSMSPTPASTPKAARCSTRVVRAAPSEHRTVLIASHELEHTRGLAAREVVLTAGQAHLDPPPDDQPAEQAVDAATEERSPLASERADTVIPPDVSDEGHEGAQGQERSLLASERTKAVIQSDVV